MRETGKALLWAIGGSLVATPFTQPVSWYIDGWLNDHPDAVPRAMLRGWIIMQSVAAYVPPWLVIGIAVGLVFAYGLLRPQAWRSTVSQSTPIPDVPRINAISTSVESRPIFPAGLYVGKIDVSAKLDQSAKHLDLYIKGFNATGESISIDRLSGHVTYQKPGGEVIQLKRIELRPDLGRFRSIANLAEMEVVVRVSLSDELATDAVAVMDTPGDNATKKTFRLGLGALDLIARADGDEKRSARLPIWAGVSVGKRPNSIIARRSRCLFEEDAAHSIELVPIRDAAAVIYERTRAADKAREDTEHGRLSYHVEQLLNFAKRGDPVLYGRVPPSRRLEPIRVGDLQSLSWNDNLDGLCFLGRNEKVRFADINIECSKIDPLCHRIRLALQRYQDFGRR